MTLYGFSGLLAQQGQQPMQADPTNSMIKLVAMVVIFFGLMWFMTIAPQRKKQKELDAMVKSMRAGDKVVTNSGIIGVIVSIKEKSVSIRSADTKLEILKSAIAEVTERGGDSGETKS